MKYYNLILSSVSKDRLMSSDLDGLCPGHLLWLRPSPKCWEGWRPDNWSPFSSHIFTAIFLCTPELFRFIFCICKYFSLQRTI